MKLASRMATGAVQEVVAIGIWEGAGADGTQETLMVVVDLLKESSRAHQAPGTVSRAGVRQIRNSGEAIGIAGVGEDERRVSGLKGLLERRQASLAGES